MAEWSVSGYTEIKALGSGGFGAVVLARHDATGTPVAIKYLLPQAAPGSRLHRHVPRRGGGARGARQPLRRAAVRVRRVDCGRGDRHGTRRRRHAAGHRLSASGKTTPGGGPGGAVRRAARPGGGARARGGPPGLQAAERARRRLRRQQADRLRHRGAGRVPRRYPSGSVAYAPPEQFDGGPATPASDVYAATATFYECLAGHPPFTGTTVGGGDPPAPYRVGADGPGARGAAADRRPRGWPRIPGTGRSDAAALAAELRAAAHGRLRARLGASAAGRTWARRRCCSPPCGRPAGVPALHATSVADGSAWPDGRTAAAPARPRRAGGPPAAQPRQGVHRWHLRHVLHREHLAHAFAPPRAWRDGGGERRRAPAHRRGRATTAAVVAAGLTVAATSRPPAGPGTAAHPAAAAYPVPLTSARDHSPAPACARHRRAGQATRTCLRPTTAALHATASFSGAIKGAANGRSASGSTPSSSPSRARRPGPGGHPETPPAARRRTCSPWSPRSRPATRLQAAAERRRRDAAGRPRPSTRSTYDSYSVPAIPFPGLSRRRSAGT